jgi:chromate transporter
LPILLDLFISFFKIGAFSFGGGYAMLPFIEDVVIYEHGWLSATEYIDILAISEMTPGPIAINSATFIGYKIAGVSGSLVSTIGVVLPSFIVISFLFYVVSRFKNTKVVEWIFQGIRPIVVGLILAAFISVFNNTVADIKAVFISVTVFLLVYVKKINPIICILIAGLLGVILY